MAVLLAGGGLILGVAALAVVVRQHLFLLAVMRRWPDGYDLRMRQRELAARVSHRRPIARCLSCRACSWTSAAFSSNDPPRWLADEARHHTRIVHGTTAPIDDRFDVVADRDHPSLEARPLASPVAPPEWPAGVTLHGAVRAGRDEAAPQQLVDLVDAMAALVTAEQHVGVDPHELADRLMDLAIKVSDAQTAHTAAVGPAADDAVGPIEASEWVVDDALAG